MWKRHSWPRFFGKSVSDFGSERVHYKSSPRPEISPSLCTSSRENAQSIDHPSTVRTPCTSSMSCLYQTTPPAPRRKFCCGTNIRRRQKNTNTRALTELMIRAAVHTIDQVLPLRTFPRPGTRRVIGRITSTPFGGEFSVAERPGDVSKACRKVSRYFNHSLDNRS